MNEKSNNSRTLTDEQMDQLLSSFYKMEVPTKIDRLPSSWPQVLNVTSGKSGQTVTMVASDGGTDRSGPSLGSRAVVAVVSLAACLTLIVASNFGKPPVEPTIPVSSGGTVSALVDDVNTTLQEIEGIDLGSGSHSSDHDSKTRHVKPANETSEK